MSAFHGKMRASDLNWMCVCVYVFLLFAHVSRAVAAEFCEQSAESHASVSVAERDRDSASHFSAIIYSGASNRFDNIYVVVGIVYRHCDRVAPPTGTCARIASTAVYMVVPIIIGRGGKISSL